MTDPSRRGPRRRSTTPDTPVTELGSSTGPQPGPQPGPSTDLDPPALAARQQQPARRRVRRVGLLAVVAFALGGGAVGTAVAAYDDPWVPPDHTIVHIEGDRKNGFGIYYKDGTEKFPPTDSEARAECDEYDTRVARVRCRTEVRTWYRDLAATRDAIRYARIAAADRVADAAAAAAAAVGKEVR